MSDQREQWQRLASMVQRAARGGVARLHDDELLEFARLYRRAAAELSHASEYGLDTRQREYLNWLVGRAYGLLYVSESTGWAGVVRFFRAELPQTLRRHWRLIAIAAALFVLPAIIGAVLVALRPDLLEVISPQLATAIDDITRRHSGGQDWLPGEIRPVMSSFIITNNIKVSFMAFATGMLLGVGTIPVLIFNGFMVGVLAAGVGRTDAALQFFAFLTPHGVIELPAIVISGAAGLLLGFAIVEPGELSRLDALRVAGREAAVIMLGVVVFLGIAGIVEGFLSPAILPVEVKFIAGALLAVGLWSYIGLAGRRREADRTTAPHAP